jgi:hypothetical protein
MEVPPAQHAAAINRKARCYSLVYDQNLVRLLAISIHIEGPNVDRPRKLS